MTILISMEENGENSRRTDELMAVREIFGEELISFESVKYGNKAMGDISVDIWVPSILNNNISLKALSADVEEEDNILLSKDDSLVSFLPPSNLKVTLNPMYPEHEECPKFLFSCIWMEKSQIDLVQEQLRNSWEMLQSEILFTWIQDLQEITDKLSLESINVVECFENFGESNYSELKEYRDIHSSKELFKFLINFHRRKEKEIFDKSELECEVCGEEYIGAQCVRFDPCRHVFCQSCTKEFFTMSINDGSLTKLRCLSEDCDSEPTHAFLKQFLDAESFTIYENQQLKVALDSMNDVVTCPRSNCETPVIADNDSNLAQCQKCTLSFCKLCLRSYHGVELCAVREERVAKIRSEYEKGDMNTKLRLERKYGRIQLLKFVHESRSLDWVSNNAKSCPSCHIQTQKTKGCNKMWCARCGCHWCWLCNSALRSNDPYSHFHKQKTPCYQKLFDGMTREELMDQFGEGADEEEERLELHERPGRVHVVDQPALPENNDRNRPAPLVEVYVAPNALGLTPGPSTNDDDTGQRDGGESQGQGNSELDMMALQLQLDLIEDENFNVEYRDDNNLYFNLN